MLPFVLSSEKLKEDVGLIRLLGDPWEKIKCLEDRGRRYGFGCFWNAGEPTDTAGHVGVERNETNVGPGGELHVRT